MSIASDEIRELVHSQWVTALKKVLASMTPETFEITVTDEKPGEDWSWYSQVLSLSPASTIWAGAADESWTTLVKSLLRAPGLEETTSEDIQSTCRDIVAQSNHTLAQDLTKRFGSEITCGGVVSSKQPEETQFIVLSVAAVMLPRPVNIAVCFDESLFKDLVHLHQGEPAELRSPPKVPSAISDLRLNLHATLGKTELPLDSILKLNIGSVIDIGRAVTDFVDVVANGKVIASGQVVAFRGNYAIKVVSTRSKTITNPAVFQGSADFGDIGTAATGNGTQLGNGIGGYDA